MSHTPLRYDVRMRIIETGSTALVNFTPATLSGANRNMVTIGIKLPAFDLQAVVSNDPASAFRPITEASDAGNGR